MRCYDMSGENNEYFTGSYITDAQPAGELVPKEINLSAESKVIIEQIIAEKDEQKVRDLTQMFNTNQNKKTLARVNKLSDLMDTITDQALARFTNRPDEISNKELFDGMKVVQDLIDRSQKQVSGAGEAPLIQVNQQTNEVNIGGTSSNLNRDSRERVKAAVIDILKGINTATAKNTNVIEVEPDAIVEEDEDD